MIFNMLYDFPCRDMAYSEERLVIENCSSLHSLTPTGRGGGEYKRGILGFGVLSLIKEVVWQIAVYFYVFSFILENSLIFLFAF